MRNSDLSDTRSSRPQPQASVPRGSGVSHPTVQEQHLLSPVALWQPTEVRDICQGHLPGPSISQGPPWPTGMWRQVGGSLRPRVLGAPYFRADQRP